MIYQTEYEVQEKIRRINHELKYLKESFKPSDVNPYGTGTVETRIRNLRYDLRVLKDLKRRIKNERDYDRAKHKALRNIFKKYNNDIHPSDIGQEWRWKVEDDEVVCTIDGKEFREKIVIDSKS